MDEPVYQNEQPSSNLPSEHNPGNLGGMDASELVKTLISNAHVPDDVAKEFWVFFSQSTKLTFLDTQVIQRKMRRFEWYRLTIIESMPKGAYNTEIERLLYAIKEEYENNLYRSKGHALNQIELLHSSTSATFAERQIAPANSQNPGWIGKLWRGITGNGGSQS